jgi:hypothetical protein
MRDTGRRPMAVCRVARRGAMAVVRDARPADPRRGVDVGGRCPRDGAAAVRWRPVVPAAPACAVPCRAQRLPTTPTSRRAELNRRRVRPSGGGRHGGLLHQGLQQHSCRVFRRYQARSTPDVRCGCTSVRHGGRGPPGAVGILGRRPAFSQRGASSPNPLLPSGVSGTPVAPPGPPDRDVSDHDDGRELGFRRADFNAPWRTRRLSRLSYRVTYAALLLLILGAHEMGHYYLPVLPRPRDAAVLHSGLRC